MTHRNLAVALLSFAMTIMSSANTYAMYDPGLGRFCSRDPIGYRGERNPFAAGMVTARVDPMGNLAIAVQEASCPGCGKAAVMWRFSDPNPDESFLVQSLCTFLYVRECELGCGCTPKSEFKTCLHCIYEKLPITDELGGDGRDLWRFPWSIPNGPCGTIGFGITISEIRSFSSSVVDSDVWNPKGEKSFCGFEIVNVGEHRLTPPTYWGNSSASYASLFFC